MEVGEHGKVVDIQQQQTHKKKLKVIWNEKRESTKMK